MTDNPNDLPPGGRTPAEKSQSLSDPGHERGRGRGRGRGSSRRQRHGFKGFFKHRSSSFWFFFVVLTLPIVVLIAYLTFRPAYKQAKRLRALAMLPGIEAATDSPEGDQAETAQLIRVLLGMARDEPRVLRVAARFASQPPQPAALEYWNEYLATGLASGDDRLLAAKTARRLGRFRNAMEWIDPLITAPSPEPEHLVEYAEILLQLQRRGDAANALEKALLDHPNHDDAKWILATLLSRDEGLGTRVRGRRILWDLAVHKGPRQERALVLLLENNLLTPTDKRTLLQLLGNQEDPALGLRLLMATLHVQLNPNDAASIVGEVLDDVIAENVTDKILRAGTWAMDAGQSLELSRRLTDETVRTNQALRALKLDAFGAMNDWPSFDKLVADMGATNILAVQKQGWYALRHHQEGRTPNAVNALSEATKAAGIRVTDLMFVASIAEQIGQTNVALQTWEILLADPVYAIPAARAIQRLDAGTDNLSYLHKALIRINEIAPLSDLVLRRLGYLHLLLAKNVPAARAIFESLLEEKPQEPRNHMGLAYADLVEGKPEAALQRVEEVSVDWTAMEPHWKAVYTSILGGANQREAARQMARSIQRNEVRSAEWELVQPWINP